MSKSSIIIENGIADGLPPVHPGEILKDELAELGLSAAAFAELLNIPANRISTILKGQRAITADTALRLAAYFGTSARFWLNLQTSYDLKVAARAAGDAIAAQVAPRAA